MTVQQHSMNDSDEEWAHKKMAKERKRLRLQGVALLVAGALITAGIMYYFGSLIINSW
ncbi:MAG: hypothetical protein ACOCV2_09870 [Persicimonas sp.]